MFCRQFIPVFCGSAYKNKGIQTLLDGVIDYLPSPLDRTHFAKDLSLDREEASKEENLIELTTNKKDPPLFLAFKLEENQFGQLTWVKVYQGMLKKGMTIQQNNGMREGQKGRKVRLNRIVRLHSDEMQDINIAQAGDICAMFGVDCASGTTFSNGKDLNNVAVSDLYVPECVVSLSVKPANKQGSVYILSYHIFSFSVFKNFNCKKNCASVCVKMGACKQFPTKKMRKMCVNS